MSSQPTSYAEVYNNFSVRDRTREKRETRKDTECLNNRIKSYLGSAMPDVKLWTTSPSAVNNRL